MTLDAQTLFVSLMVNVTLMSAALSLGVRWKTHSGIRAWNISLMLQGLGWAALLLAYRVWHRELATLGVAAMLAAFSFTHVAAKAYCHEPASRLWVWGLPVVVTVIHWIMFADTPGRIALVNAAIAVQLLWIAVVLLRPRPIDWRWRALAGGCLIMSAAMVIARLVLVLAEPRSYPTFEKPHWINTGGLLVNNANLIVGTLAFLLAHRNEAEHELKRLATTDGLTGVTNRRHWMEAGANHLRLAGRHGQPLTAMMLDIDHFKRVNDTHGHAVGDRALVLFATALQRVVRGPDLVGRYGGEEFCVLLPQSGTDAARAIDRRLRALVAREVDPELGFPLTFSVGVAERAPGGTSLERMLGDADEALYRAKAAGRARLEVAAANPDAARTLPATG